MAVYTVHQRNRPDDPLANAVDGTLFVRDGFHWLAFLVPFVWLAAHRLWLALLGYLALLVVLQVLALLPGGESVVPAIYLALSVLIGFEASTLRRWTLARAGWVFCGIVCGRSREECERRFFAGGRIADPQSQAPPAIRQDKGPAPQPHPAGDGVLGVFPTPERP